MDKLKKILQIHFLFLGIIIIYGCSDTDEVIIIDDMPERKVMDNNKSCKVDSDCVPASCCHSTDVVNKENAPGCENLKCTLSCETILDCGQGRPVCNEGQCEIEKNIDGNLGIEEIEEVKDDKISDRKVCPAIARICKDGSSAKTQLDSCKQICPEDN